MQNKVTQLDYRGHNIYVGLDTHLRSWKVTIRVDLNYYKTFSQDPSPEILYKYLVRNFPNGTYFSAYEASFSGFTAHRELNKLGIKNIVVNPADIPTTDKERKQKDDARDSRKIAEQLAGSNLIGIYVPSIEIESDRALLRYRRTQVKEISRNKNRIKSFLYFHGITIPKQFAEKSYWSKHFTKWLLEVELPLQSMRTTLTEIIETVEFIRKSQYRLLRKIRLLSQTEKYKANASFLISVPGVGLKTVMSFLTEVDDITRFKNLDQLCSFVGLIPTTNSSGEKESIGNITKRQNKVLRSIIIESSWIAIRNDPALMLAYQNLTKRMKPTKAIIKIAKKLINRMRYVLKNQTFYETAVVQ